MDSETFLFISKQAVTPNDSNREKLCTNYMQLPLKRRK